MPAEPASVDEKSSTATLRTIATFEAAKGIAVLLIGLGLLTLLHKDVQREAENFIVHLHLNPDRRISQALLHAASHVNDARLWTYASACLIYTIVRFTEAYGLWNRRVWAEYFALLSGSLYLPWEVLQVIEHATFWHWTMLLVNLAIVLYMAYIRIAACVPPNCPPFRKNAPGPV
jgi:uncharacterized membrane protein (DUF2068 family)